MGDKTRRGSGTTPTRETPTPAGSSNTDRDDGVGRHDRTPEERTSPPPDSRASRHSPVSRSRAGSMWVGSILAASVLVLLLVFILQNRVPVEISFLGWAGTLPSGVALLLAAVAGLVVVAIPGTVRMLQLRRTARKKRA